MEYLMIGIAIFIVAMTVLGNGSRVVMCVYLAFLGLLYYAHLTTEKLEEVESGLQSKYFDYKQDKVKSEVIVAQGKEVSFAANNEAAARQAADTTN